MTVRHIVARMQAHDLLGNKAPGAKIRFYDPTTTTPRVVYSDTARTIPITQPVVADAAAFFVQIYMQDGAYKYTLHSSSDVLIDTEDNVDPGLSTGAGALAVASGGTGATTAAGARSNLGAFSQVAGDALDTRVADVETLLDNPILAASVTQAYAASFTPVFTSSQTRDVTLTGPLTLNAGTVTAGQFYCLNLIQDATGSRTWSVNSAYKFPGNAVPPLSTTANAVDVLFGYARTTSILEVLSFKRQDALSDICIIEDQKAQNTAGGTFTSGADRTRTLNTTVTNLAGFMTGLSSNQFTLIAGTYDISWEAPAQACDGHQSFLYNVTDAAVVQRGGSSTTGAQTLSNGRTIVSISSSKAFEIRHRCTTTRATDGFGVAANFGTEVYSRVIIRRLPQ